MCSLIIKPLTFALSSAMDRTPQPSRHLSYIAEFAADIRHISSPQNVVADTMSQPSMTPSVSAVALLDIDFKAMANCQVEADAKDTSLHLVRVDWNGSHMLCDNSLGVLLPEAYRRPGVFNTLHGFSHPIVKPLTGLISSRFIWSSL